MSAAISFRPRAEMLEGRETPSATPIFAIGGGSGSSPRLQVYNVGNGQKLADFLAFENTFTGGVQSGIGDVNNDGFPDVIVGAGVGGGPRVRIFDGRAFSPASTGFGRAPTDGISPINPSLVLADFFAFENSQRGGTTVTAGNFFGIANADVVVGAGPGGGPRVRILDGLAITNQQTTFTSERPGDTVANFFAFESSFRNGVTVSAAPVLVGRSFLAVAPGLGGGPRVRVLDGNQIATQTLNYNGTQPRDVLADFFVGNPNTRTGLYVSAGDFNQDGTNDVAVGTGPGQTNSYTIFNGVRLTQGNFTGNGPNDIVDQFTFSNFSNGVTVGAAVQTQQSALLLVGTGGQGQLGRVTALTLSGAPGFVNRTTTYDLLFDPSFLGGVFVSQ